MADQNKMMILISAFILLLVGIILTSEVANSNSKARSLGTVTDDQFTADNASCVQITTGCIDSITLVENATKATTVGSANYTLCRSSTTHLQDGIQLKDGAQMAGESLDGFTLNATYTQSADCTYVSDATSRVFLNLIPLFFAIAVMLVGVWLWMKSKEGAY